MSLAEQLAKLLPSRQECMTCYHMATLPEPDNARFREVVASEVGYKRISKVMSENGLFLPGEHLRLHRLDKHVAPERPAAADESA